MQVREKTKQKEVGFTPEDWNIVTLGDVMDFRNGVNADKDAYGSGVKFVNVMEIIANAHLLSSQIPGKISLPRALINAFAVESGDVLFNRTSETQQELGLASVFLGSEEDIVFGGFVIRGRAKTLSLDHTFSGYGLRSHAVRSQIMAKGQGAIRANIGQADLRMVVLPLPPIAEQRAIATALSDVDALTSSLDRLIAKKREIKQAAMQQLLTGRKRLPGFDQGADFQSTEIGLIPADWRFVNVLELARKIIDYRGRTPLKLGLNWGGGDIPALSAGNVKMGYIDLEVETYFGSFELYKRWMTSGDAEEGDVLVTTEAPLGNIALIPDSRKYILSQRTIMLKFDANVVLSKFVLYQMMARQFQSQLVANASGSTATGIKRKTFEKLLLVLPPLQEQREIVCVLEEMDRDITALCRRHSKTLLLKQGMMQELLSGRTRLV